MAEQATKHSVYEDSTPPRHFRPFSMLPPPPPHPPPTLASRSSAASSQGSSGNRPAIVGGSDGEEVIKVAASGEDSDHPVDLDDIELVEKVQDDHEEIDQMAAQGGDDSKESRKLTTPVEMKGRKKVGARRKRLGDLSDESDDLEEDPEYANIGFKFTAELESEDKDDGVICIDLIHPKVRKHHGQDKEGKAQAVDEPVQLRGPGSGPEESRKHKQRPNSNYRNMAPLPPPTSESPEPYIRPLTTKTTGESSSSTKEVSSECDVAHSHMAPDAAPKPPVRIKPKNRAPIPPPPFASKRKSGAGGESESSVPDAASEKKDPGACQPPTAQKLVKPNLRKLPSAPSAPGPPIKPPRHRNAADRAKAVSSSTKETGKHSPFTSSKNPSSVAEKETETVKIISPGEGAATSAPDGKAVGQVKKSTSPHQHKRAPPPPPPPGDSSSSSMKDLEPSESKEQSFESNLTAGSSSSSSSLREDITTDKSLSSSKQKITPSRAAPPPPQGSSSCSPRPLRKVPLQDSAKKAEKELETTVPLAPPLPPKPAAYLDGPEPSLLNSSNIFVSSQWEESAPSVVSEHVSSTVSAMKASAQSILERTFPLSESYRTSEEAPVGCDMLSKMDYFSVELHKSEGQGYGMQIAEGTCATNKGHEMKGVFVMGVKCGSPAEASGRIKTQDMLLEIGGVTVVGSSLEDVAQLLKSSGNTVKVKLGRAQVGTDTSETPTTLVHGQQLMASQGENAKLQKKIDELEKELLQSRDAETDLTQALGKVTIEKTRMEREIQKLRSQASDHSNDQLAEALSNNKTLKAKLDEANSKVQTLETELQTSRETISRLQSENKALTQKLEEAMQELNKERENVSKSSEELINLRSELDRERRAREKAEQTLTQAQREVAALGAADVHGENKDSVELESVEETDSPLPTTLGTKLVENGEAINDETVAVVMTEATMKLVEEHSEEAVGNEKEQPSTEDAVMEEKEGEKEGDIVVKAEGVTLTLPDEAKDSASEIDDEEFDKVGTLKCLDNTSALEKAHLFAKRGRKRPSRKHIQTMAHQSPFPEEMPALKVLEGSGSTATHPPHGSTPPPKLPKPEPKPGPKPKPSEQAKPHPQALAPKPKPRPQPRKKPSPEHTSDATAAQTPEVSKKPIPMPRSPSQEVSSEDVDQPALGGERLSSPTDTLSQSPIHSGKMAPAIAASKSPKASPVHVRKNANEEPPSSSSPAPPKKPKPHPPKPSPRPHKPDDSKAAEEKSPDSGDSKLEELQNKDPSELTVKEKMMLAQAAMAKQAEHKSKGLPPVVRKKPPVKAPSVGYDLDEHLQRGSVHEQDIESSMERSKSMENVLEDGHSTPDQRRKLPPGAFNISIPMGIPGEMRHRSATHAGITSPDHVKRSSKEVDSAQYDQQDQPQVLSQDSHGTPSRKSEVPETPLSEGTPQHLDSAISTPEGSRRNRVADSMGMDESEDDLDNEVEAEADPDSLMQQVSSSPPSAKPDPEQVLFWNPEVVGMWLRNFGLGKHSSAFMEKNIKGHMLFELDGAKLKGLGVTSSDEKAVFKKEIKALKPFADKIKKEYEKTKKDEKKKADQEKKLAKKKKK